MEIRKENKTEDAKQTGKGLIEKCWNPREPPPTLSLSIFLQPDWPNARSWIMKGMCGF